MALPGTWVQLIMKLVMSIVAYWATGVLKVLTPAPKSDFYQKCFMNHYNTLFICYDYKVFLYGAALGDL